jgi:hypothetical protein
MELIPGFIYAVPMPVLKIISVCPCRFRKIPEFWNCGFGIIIPKPLEILEYGYIILSNRVKE